MVVHGEYRQLQTTCHLLRGHPECHEFQHSRFPEAQLIPGCGREHDWAPDGKHIVMTVNANPGSHPTRSGNLATIRPDGSGFQLLTHFEHRTIGAYVGGYSPDGQWIVYRLETGDSRGTLPDGRFGLYKIHPWGGKPVLIASLLLRPRFIDWGTAR